VAAVKIAVGGAGVGGSVVARLARERGHDVTVYDPAPATAASRAALCVLRREWLPAPSRPMLRDALAMYVRWNAIRIQGGVVSTWRSGPRDGYACVAVSPDRVLIEPDELTPLPPVDGPTVVAFGAAISGGEKLTGGATLVFPSSTTGVWVHYPRPRHSIVLACYDGFGRFGSPVAPTLDRAVERICNDVQIAERVGMLDWVDRANDPTLLIGLRVMAAQPRYKRVGDQEWQIGGFGRVGYSTAPTLAASLLDEMERACA
jgi:hypothetical protein